MTPILRSLVVLLACAGAAVAASPSGETPRPANDGTKVQLHDAQDHLVGEAVLRETPNGVLVTASFKALPKGEHAFHIHEKGVCTPPFDSAGGHFNPTSHKHGFENAEGPHAGDMPNVYVPSGGALEVEVLARGVTLQEGKPNSLLDGDGSALVVHSGVDDYQTDPAGNAGSRIACGPIVRTTAAADQATHSSRAASPPREAK
jgi:Cu-Zn family superoxide dismutase